MSKVFNPKSQAHRTRRRRQEANKSKCEGPMPPPSHEFTRVLQCFCSSASNADPSAHQVAHNLPTQAPKSHRLQIRWGGAKQFGEISKAKLCGSKDPPTHDRSTGNPTRTANQPDLQPSSQPTNQLTNQQESRYMSTCKKIRRLLAASFFKKKIGLITNSTGQNVFMSRPISLSAQKLLKH